jgi:hypothetical protein
VIQTEFNYAHQLWISRWESVLLFFLFVPGTYQCQAMWACRVVEVKLHSFLTSVPDCEWFHTSCFIPEERALLHSLKKRLVGPRARLDSEARRKVFCTCREFNQSRPARGLSLYKLKIAKTKKKAQRLFKTGYNCRNRGRPAWNTWLSMVYCNIKY